MGVDRAPQAGFGFRQFGGAADGSGRGKFFRKRTVKSRENLVDMDLKIFRRLCGAVAISFALAHVHPTTIGLAAFTVLFAWLAYGVLNVNYALFSMAVMGYIVFLLSLNEIPGHTLAARRTFCTALGGAIALCVRVIVISYRRRHWVRAIAALRQAVAGPRSFTG